MLLLNDAIGLYKKYMLNMDRSRETIKSYTVGLGLFSAFLSELYNGPVYLDEIRLHDVESYLNMLAGRNYTSASRNHSLYILRSFFNFCVRKEFIAKNVCIGLDRIPQPRKERVFLTDEEVKTLVREVRPPIARLVVNTLYYTGMRISECLNLELKDTDLDKSVITVRSAKNKKDRQIPVHQELRSLLSDYVNVLRRRKQSPYLFTTCKTDRVSPDYVNRILKETVARLGWQKKVTCHTLRHSFASRLVAGNINVVNIQRLLGHSDLSTTSVYTHTNMHELKNAISVI